MPLAHLAIGSRDVQRTAEFLCRTMGWELIHAPANAPREVAWLDVSTRRDRSQQIHVIYVEDFSVSPFEREFGRHLAVLHDGRDMAALRQRISEQGGELIAPVRPTPFERFFFREPVNGYVFEVIHEDQWTSEQPATHSAAENLSQNRLGGGDSDYSLRGRSPILPDTLGKIGTVTGDSGSDRMTAAEKLRELGIELPPPPPAVAAYRPWSRVGNLVVTSGQLPWQNGKIAFAGRLGEALSVEQGYQAARLCAINAIAQINDAVGDLERIVQIVRLEGFVHCAAGFRGHPDVLNGASHLVEAVFGQRNKHSRLAVGIADMPLDAAVQLVMMAEVRVE